MAWKLSWTGIDVETYDTRGNASKHKHVTSLRPMFMRLKQKDNNLEIAT